MFLRSFLTMLALLLYIPLGHAQTAIEVLSEVNSTLDQYDSNATTHTAPSPAVASNPSEVVQAEAAPAAAPVVAETAPEPASTSNPIAAMAPTEEAPTTLFGDFLKKYDMLPTGSVTMDYYNRYVWRGQYLDRDPVLQPGISLSAKGFTVGYWSSWDMEGVDSLNSDESDYYVSYAYTFNPVTLTAGHTWYSFPGTSTSSKEYFLSAGLMSNFFAPVFTFYHDYEDGKDIGQGKGNYYTLAASHTFDVMKKYGISLSLGATVGWVDHQWINGTGWHFTPTAALNIPITKSMTISPTIGYNAPRGDLKDPAIGNQENSSFGGVHTVINF